MNEQARDELFGAADHAACSRLGLEEQARRVANRVMSISHTDQQQPVARYAQHGGPGQAGSAQSMKLATAIRQRTKGAGATTAAVLVHDALRTPGSPLNASTRAFMEHRIGCDFGSVRLHTDMKAAQSARALGAQAYALGRDVVFGRNYYSPGTQAGLRLLAHELVHVVQQSRGAPQEIQCFDGPPHSDSTLSSPAELPPGRTWHVIIVGAPGPNEVAAGHRDQFLRAAEIHSFSALGQTSDPVWLVERTGYDLAGLSPTYIRARGPRHVFFIDQQVSLVSLLNQFPHGSISRVDAYSHGVPGAMMLRYGWPGRANYGLSTDEARSLSPTAFSPDAQLSFDSCNSATVRAGASLAGAVAQSTQRISRGWTGRTSYRRVNDERRPDEREVVASEIMSDAGSFDAAELGSQLQGRHPVRTTLRPRSSAGSFTSYVAIAARLPESRLFTVPREGEVGVTIASETEYSRANGLSMFLILWRSIDWGRDDDNGGPRRVSIGSRATLQWTDLSEGTYFLEMYHPHGVLVNAAIEVDVRPQTIFDGPLREDATVFTRRPPTAETLRRFGSVVTVPATQAPVQEERAEQAARTELQPADEGAYASASEELVLSRLPDADERAHYRSVARANAACESGGTYTRSRTGTSAGRPASLGRGQLLVPLQVARTLAILQNNQFPALVERLRDDGLSVEGLLDIDRRGQLASAYAALMMIEDPNALRGSEADGVNAAIRGAMRVLSRHISEQSVTDLRERALSGDIAEAASTHGGDYLRLVYSGVSQNSAARGDASDLRTMHVYGRFTRGSRAFVSRFKAFANSQRDASSTPPDAEVAAAMQALGSSTSDEALRAWYRAAHAEEVAILMARRSNDGALRNPADENAFTADTSQQSLDWAQSHLIAREDRAGWYTRGAMASPYWTRFERVLPALDRLNTEARHLDNYAAAGEAVEGMLMQIENPIERALARGQVARVHHGAPRDFHAWFRSDQVDTVQKYREVLRDIFASASNRKNGIFNFTLNFILQGRHFDDEYAPTIQTQLPDAQVARLIRVIQRRERPSPRRRRRP